MRMYDLIMKKRNGHTLSGEEIRYMITEYTADRIPDYQMSAMMMAIYFQGMSEEETLHLTMAMAESPCPYSDGGCLWYQNCQDERTGTRTYRRND